MDAVTQAQNKQDTKQTHISFRSWHLRSKEIFAIERVNHSAPGPEIYGVVQYKNYCTVALELGSETLECGQAQLFTGSSENLLICARHGK